MEIDYGRVLREGWRLLALAGVFGIVLGIGSNLLVETFYIVSHAVQIGEFNGRPILTIEDAAMRVQNLVHQAADSVRSERSRTKSEWTFRVEKEPPKVVRFSIRSTSPDLAEDLAKRLARLIAEDHQKRMDEEQRRFEDETREVEQLRRESILRIQEILKEMEAIKKRMMHITSGKGPLTPNEVQLLQNLFTTEQKFINLQVSLLQVAQGFSRSRFIATQIYPMNPNPVVDRGIGVKGRAILGGIVGIFLGTFFLITRAMRHGGKATP